MLGQARRHAVQPEEEATHAQGMPPSIDRNEIIFMRVNYKNVVLGFSPSRNLWETWWPCVFVATGKEVLRKSRFRRWRSSFCRRSTAVSFVSSVLPKWCSEFTTEQFSLRLLWVIKGIVFRINSLAAYQIYLKVLICRIVACQEQSIQTPLWFNS